MATLSYEDIQKLNERAANRANGNQSAEQSNRPRVGWFGLKDKESCLVRFNVKSIADLNTYTIHRPIFQHEFTGLPTKFGGVECLNDPIARKYDACPFCKAAKDGDDTIGKVSQVMFVEMMVAKNDSNSSTGYSQPEAVTWERPSKFGTDLTQLMADYLPGFKTGDRDLSKVLFKITRNGKTKDDTRYNISLASPTMYDPNLVPEDFSAFDGFDLSKRRFFKKTADEMEEFIRNRSFPAPQKNNNQETNASQTTSVQKQDAVIEAAVVENKTVEKTTETKTTSAPKSDDGFDWNF